LNDTVQIAFGKVLRKYRLQQNLSQEKLAELANLDRTYISQIERGLKSPSIKTLLALAQALQVDAHLLVADLESELSISPVQEKPPGSVRRNS
jgi:transcriptional regulator with XRE-family HTH domain